MSRERQKNTPETWQPMSGVNVFYSLLFVPVVIYSLYIIVIFQKIQSSLQVLDGSFVCQFYIVLRDHPTRGSQTTFSVTADQD